MNMNTINVEISNGYIVYPFSWFKLCTLDSVVDQEYMYV